MSKYDRYKKIVDSHEEYVEWWLPIDVAAGSVMAPMSLQRFCELMLTLPNNNFFDRWSKGDYNKVDVLDYLKKTFYYEIKETPEEKLITQLTNQFKDKGIDRYQCKYNLTWDYLEWKNYGDTTATQEDWNQTLITKVNQISNKIHRASRQRGANTVELPPTILEILKTLPFYDVTNQTLSNRLKVKINPEIKSNIVYVYNDIIFGDMKMVAKIDDDNDNSNDFHKELRFTPFVLLSPIDQIEHKKTLAGYIEILNYEHIR